MKRFLTIVVLIYCTSFISNAQIEQSGKGYNALTDSVGIGKAIGEAARTYDEFPDSANALLDRVYQRSITLRYTYGSGMAMLYKGIIATNRNQLEQARTSLDKALADLRQTPYGQKELHLVYTNLGNLAFLKGNYEEALQLQYKAIRSGEQFPGTDVDYLYANVAAILIHTGSSTERIKQYVEKARRSTLRKNDVRTLSKIYNNIALSFSVEKKWDSSITYFRKALNIARINRMFPLQHLALSNIGIIYLEQNKTDSALLYLQQAKVMDTAAVAVARERARGALGVVYLQQHQFNLARPLLQEQYQLAAQRNNKQDLREAYYNLSRLYGAEGDYRKGYTSAWNYITLNDSIAGAEIVSNVHKIEAKYRAAEREKQLLGNKLKLLAQQKALAAKNKWLLLAVVTGLLLLVVVLLVRRNYQHKKKLLSEQLRNMEHDQAIKGLKATIEGEEKERLRIAQELHDGLGALVSAAKMNLGILGQKTAETASGDIYHSTLQLLDEIGNELRITAHNMMPVAIMDRDLPAAIQHFCRYTGKAKRLQIDVQAYGTFVSLPDNIQLTVYRIVQELINNVVKHAQAGIVLVQLVLQDTLLSITVEDDGRGFDYTDDKHFDGVGLRSIRDRVKSTNGTMSLRSRPAKGTSVYIEWEVHPGAYQH